MVRVEQRVMVACAVCRVLYDVSARTNRNIKAGRSVAACMLHRRRRRPETEMAVYRRWWLDRYTMEEIVEIAEGVWPRPSQLEVVPEREGPTHV